MWLVSSLQKKLFTFIGDICLMGWKHPMWIVVKPRQHQFKSDEYQEMVRLVQKRVIKQGDILLRKFDGYLDTYIIPGDMNHGGIYVGTVKGKKYQVIHSISDGVVQESIFDFMRTDHFAVIRPSTKLVTEEEVKEAISIAIECKGRPYDFSFRYTDNFALYCTELIGYCYRNAKKFNFKFKDQGFGKWRRKALTADDILLSDVEIVFMTSSIKKMRVFGKKLAQQK